MAQYKITYTNQTRRSPELLEIHEYKNAPFFSKTMYKNTVAAMFFYASQSCEYRDLIAIVERDGEKVLRLVMITKADGSTIYSIPGIARPHKIYRHVRTMFIAN